MNLAAGKRRLEDIGRVERPFRRPRSHQGVQFVDEDDGVLRLHQFLHDGLQALLELAAVFGARHDQGQVEAQDALVGQERRHVAVRDALRQPLHNRGLSHSRLANQDGIVLGAAAQNLDHPLELVLAPDERIKLVLHRRLGQVTAEFGKQGRFLRPAG